MKGKAVFVSGSSRGIGFAVAEAFGLLGANVVINCSKSANELNRAEELLLARGIKVYTVMGDVSDYNTCKRVINAAAAYVGEIDILVNNVGISKIGLFTEQSIDEMKRVAEVNQYSVLNCCYLTLPSMIRNKKGHIINISSIWGITGASCEVAYSASKGWVNTFTKALAKEVAPSNVFVNAIACGVIDTSMNNCFSDEEKEDIVQSIGLLRMGRPSDVAELCVYLSKTDYMTGQIVTLDGGKI